LVNLPTQLKKNHGRLLIKITRTLFLTDQHRPFHDPRAESLALDVAQDVGVDRIFINGDLIDNTNCSMHGPKHPEIVTTLEQEFESGIDFLTDLRKRFPTQEIIFNAGNHEYRLDRFIIQHAKPFWNMLTVQKQLQLEHFNVQYYPYNSEVQLEGSNVWCQHSPPSYAEAGPMTSLKKKLDRTYLWGCTHRLGASYLTTAGGNLVAGYFTGWLGSTTLTEQHKHVFSYTKGHENWQQGFAIITIIDGVEAHIQQIPIINYRCVVDGSLYES